MASFIPNTGDIILDAVLTDEGRRRLAKGDGSFNITKFALGDAEINYNLYDHNAGSAYADLHILSSPVFEAFTDNAMALPTRLMSLTKTNHLYLNTIIANTKASTGQPLAGGTNADMYNLLCTTNAYNKYAGGNLPDGYLDGRDAVKAAAKTNMLTLDQGLNTTAVSFKLALDPELTENQMMIKLDDRYLKLVAPSPSSQDASPSFIDDDNIATYYLVNNAANSAHWGITPGGSNAEEGDSDISGPRGPRFHFSVRCQLDLQASTSTFTTAGSTLEDFWGSGDHALYIDTMVTCIGNQTGARVDIPFRLLRED